MREDLLPTTPTGRLIRLIQEAAEVQKAVTKLMIFGATATDPGTNKSYDNVKDLIDEMDDLTHAIGLVRTDISNNVHK